ncbi:MAG: hypothetical protein IK066_00715 [Kiritimatiellae bacterium]|nr:hypothetical protein [Kiritimatiellia bacterium]
MSGVRTRDGAEPRAPEGVVAVLAEMRKHFGPLADPTVPSAGFDVAGDALGFADRFEAAWKAERTEWDHAIRDTMNDRRRFRLAMVRPLWNILENAKGYAEQIESKTGCPDVAGTIAEEAERGLRIIAKTVGGTETARPPDSDVEEKGGEE